MRSSIFKLFKLIQFSIISEISINSKHLLLISFSNSLDKEFISSFCSFVIYSFNFIFSSFSLLNKELISFDFSIIISIIVIISFDEIFNIFLTSVKFFAKDNNLNILSFEIFLILPK